jgi:hypothetical protein
VKAAALADQIAKEKELLKLDLDRMESEKVELANRLALNEEQIKESSQVKSEQLTKEHEELQRMLKQMADEKAELNAKLKLIDAAGSLILGLARLVLWPNLYSRMKEITKLLGLNLTYKNFEVI